jgi:hypothetical protein
VRASKGVLAETEEGVGSRNRNRNGLGSERIV